MSDKVTDRVRVLRVIEYIGDREWVEKTLSRSIKGSFILPEGRRINTAIIGDFPEILEKEVSVGIPDNGNFQEVDRQEK